ncbi:hypothetical protein IFM89_005906 [Coptis chinensis]|uniref:TORTIFOLIA1/SINE1-2 N-terminal domain-containing protein n=1 Tax=Coptis chinensis TaxID=261450 RepID=A0A835HNX2_9MAGN|nr:hypothetical protein IFM89_005906 [Coptis chinensis]
MTQPKRSSPTHELKKRVITCLNKLSDRDTHTQATTELETIIKSLTHHDSFASFLTCIYETDSSSKTQVRKQCVRLLGFISIIHGNALTPFVPKMISNIIKRLHDSDSVVRTACVDSVTIMCSSISKVSFFTLFLKPFMETMLFEQDYNSQMGSTLCLTSAIEACNDPEVVHLQRVLTKFVKLLRSESFKAKPALLSLIRSVIGVGVSMNRNVLRDLIGCLVEFLSNEDWAARKASAEALLKLGLACRDMLSEFKSSCLVSFEARRFDKVKVVRETMNQMIDAWKDVPGSYGEVSPPLQSRASSIDNTTGECSPSSSVSSNAVSSDSTQTKRNTIPASRSPPSNNSTRRTARKRGPMKNTNRISTPLFQRPDYNKNLDWKIEASVPHTSNFIMDSEDRFEERNEKIQEPEMNQKVQESEVQKNSQHPKPEDRSNFFNKNSDEKIHKVGGFSPGSRVVLYNDECSESTVSNDSEEHNGNLKETEDLSLIRKQLLQIENQQSILLDLLQRFMGSSQNGIRSLETRVNGLEMALDEIMYDMTVSTGRTSTSDPSENTCCKLPGAEFLSPKFWKKTDGRYSTSRFTFSGSNSWPHNMVDKDTSAEPSKLENRKFYHQAGGGGFVVNPLAAENRNDFRRNPEVYSNSLHTSIFQDAGRRQARTGTGL